MEKQPARPFNNTLYVLQVSVDLHSHALTDHGPKRHPRDRTAPASACCVLVHACKRVCVCMFVCVCMIVCFFVCVFGVCVFMLVVQPPSPWEHLHEVIPLFTI